MTITNITLEALLEQAKAIAAQQGDLGRSPVELRGGSAIFCGGSCLALAALELRGGRHEVLALASDLVGDRDSSAIVHTLKAVGVSERVARWVIRENDRTAPPVRLAWFMSLSHEGLAAV
jgi:hypothetical protein